MYRYVYLHTYIPFYLHIYISTFLQTYVPTHLQVFLFTYCTCILFSSTNQGDIMKLYGELCELEIVQSKKNPENKSVYQSLSLSIREACTRFTNQLSVCKTHLKKPTAKARGKAKAVPPKNEEED